MHETIIFAPDANSAELLRTMTKYGRNTFGLRIMNSVEISEYAAMRMGMTYGKRLINSGDSVSLIYDIISRIEHFRPISFRTAYDIFHTICMIRMMIPENERSVMREKLTDTEFSENGSALLETYEKYIYRLETEGFIDSIGLIRFAAENVKKLNADIMIFEEYPLTPLEKQLLFCISGGNYIETSMLDFIGTDERSFNILDITESYGTANEVRDVISTVFGNGIPADKCVVACTDTQIYSRLFYEIACEFELPVTFGCGMPLTGSNCGKLLKSYYDWNTTGFNGKTALENMIFSNAFDKEKLCETLAADKNSFRKIIEYVGRMKLSADANKNKDKFKILDKYEDDKDIISSVKKMADELEKGCSYFIRNYSYIRKDSAHSYDVSAMKTICTELDRFTAVSDDSVNEIIPSILKMNTFSENSREGHLHITGIKNTVDVIRENLFIVGMSAEQFPGTPAENYLLTDSDMLRFGENAPTSENIVSQKRDILYSLIRTASSLKSNIHISYSGFDTAELKAVNASSLIFEIYRKQYGESVNMQDFEKSVRHVGYFSSLFYPFENAAKAYAEGAEIGKFLKEENNEMSDSMNISDMSFSVTDIEKYIKCQKMFYYKSVLDISETDEYNPFLLVSHLEKGTVFHELMKMNAYSRMSLDELKSNAEKMWYSLIHKFAPFNSDEAENGKDEFMEMAEYGYFSDKDNTVKMAEEKLEYTHSSGITLTGVLDRLETTPEGLNIIADFKTGKSKDYHENDFNSCIQIILYAYMLRQRGIEVSYGEYRFAKEGINISCVINNEFLDMADKLLSEIADSVKSELYSYTDKCDYCHYKSICGNKEAKK